METPARTLGVVCEYNPMHLGHVYMLEEARRRSLASCTVCVMSGNYVQRSAPALLDKWERAELAVRLGADLVLELPTVYAMSSAANFAWGAIALLASAKVTDVAFGCETEDAAFLTAVADVLVNEPENYRSIMKKQLAVGESFIRARTTALTEVLGLDAAQTALLGNSGVILGIHYIEAMHKLHWYPHVIPILRCGNAHHDLSVQGEFLSGSAIRQRIQQAASAASSSVWEACKAGLSSYVAEPVLQALDRAWDEKRLAVSDQWFTEALYAKLALMGTEELSGIAEVSEGLEHAVFQAASVYRPMEELCSRLSSRRYASARIRRILMNTVLGITKELQTQWVQKLPYRKILAMNDAGQAFLRRQKEAGLPDAPDEAYVTNPGAAQKTLSVSAQQYLALEAGWTDLYMLLLPGRGRYSRGLEYRRTAIKL